MAHKGRKKAKLGPNTNFPFLQDISFSSTFSETFPTIRTKILQFLAFINPEQVPLHIAAGSCFNVVEQSGEIQGLLGSHDESRLEDMFDEGPVALLAKADQKDENLDGIVEYPRITEILFFVEQIERHKQKRLSDDETSFPQLLALPLSSDLLFVPHKSDDFSSKVEESRARFTERSNDTGVSESAPTRERLSSLFDNASDQRRKVRRKGGQGVSLAAARGLGGADTTFAAFQYPSTETKAEDNHSRGLSPALVHNPTVRRSGLVQASSDQTSPQDTGQHGFSQDLYTKSGSQIEERNKHTVSRTIMAAMRIHGLQQRKKSRSTNGAEDVTMRSDDEDNDADYKGIYHQTYKGTVFAFRKELASTVLSAESIQDVAEKLLAIFCTQSP